jgi:hypothetical protein
MIAMVITLVAGFVGREIAFVEIQRVWIPTELQTKGGVFYSEFRNNGSDVFFESDDHSTWYIDPIIIGMDIDLKKFVRMQPAKSKFADLQCNYRNGTTPNDDPPAIINSHGMLQGLRQDLRTLTIDIMAGSQRQLTLIIYGVTI